MLYMLSDMHRMLNSSTQGELHKHVFKPHTTVAYARNVRTADGATCKHCWSGFMHTDTCVVAWQVHAAPFS